MNELLQYLTIGEVSKKFDLSQHTLRFWEKELKDVLRPLRTRGRQRRYTPEHLAIIQEIKNLKSRGLSLSEIKQIMGKRETDNNANFEIVDRAAREIAEVIRLALRSFLQKQDMR